jgi:hypothetical protein
MFRIPGFIFVFLSSLTAIPAGAQATPPVKAEPSPKPPHTAKSSGFRSTFENYQRFDAELPLTDWRKVNETVHDRGGWKAYARESVKANAAKPVGEGK